MEKINLVIATSYGIEVFRKERKRKTYSSQTSMLYRLVCTLEQRRFRFYPMFSGIGWMAFSENYYDDL